MWPNPRFCSKLYVEGENVDFSKSVGPIKYFAPNCHFWPTWSCPVWKFQFQKCWPDQGFCSKLLFLITADMSRLKNSFFPINVARSRILLKIPFLSTADMSRMNISIFPVNVARSKIFLRIVIFDHHGHVQAKNFIFINKGGPIQDFAQNCHFLPPRTCPG